MGNWILKKTDILNELQGHNKLLFSFSGSGYNKSLLGVIKTLQFKHFLPFLTGMCNLVRVC